MVADWRELTGANHDFLDPTYKMAKYVWKDMIAKGTLDELNDDTDLVHADFNDFGKWWEDNESDVFTHYRGFTVCFFLAFVLIGLLILTAICLCCYGCCTRCRRKNPKTSATISRPTGGFDDDKSFTWVQVVCLFLFLIIIGAMLMGVVIMFVARSAMTDELKYKKVFETVHSSAVKAQDFIDHTWEQAQASALQIYKTGQNKIMATLNAIPETAQTYIGKQSNVTALLNQSAIFFQRIATDADAVDDSTSELTTEGDQLAQELDQLSSKLKNLLPDCESDPRCQQILDDMTVSADYTGAQNLSQLAESATKATAACKDGHKKLNPVQEGIRRGIDPEIKEVEEALDEGYEALVKETTNIGDLADGLELPQRVDEYDEKGQKYDVEKYLDIAFICIGVLTGLLIPTVVLYLNGWLHGVIGRKTKSCCREKHAPCLIMCGAGLLFLPLILVILVSMLLLIATGVVQTDVCRYFALPDDFQRSLTTLDLLIMQQTSIEVQFVNGVVNCERNVTLFSAMVFEDAEDIDLNETLDPEAYGIPGLIKLILGAAFTISEVELVPEDDLVAVNNDLGKVDYDGLIASFSGNVTKKPLGDLANDLEPYQNSSTNQTAFQGLLKDLVSLETTLVRKMMSQQKTTVKKIQDIRTAALETSIPDLIINLTNAQKEVNTAGANLASEVISETIDLVLETVEQVFSSLLNDLLYTIGHCGPLHYTIYNVLSYVCVDLFYPINALWFGMGWFAAFSILSIFVGFYISRIFSEDDSVDGYYSSTYSPEPIVHKTYI